MRRKLFVVLGVCILLMLGTWSPWLTQNYAEARAIHSFTKSWQYVADGCGINCTGCGAVESRRVPFGSLVTIEYACGLIPEDSPAYHQRATAFVSLLGTVHGLPKP